jgi:molybdopterin molybdotransferase
VTSDSPVRPSWHEARGLSIEAGTERALPAQSTALAASIGRTLARSLVAARAIPHFDSAAMDGWAVGGEGPWVVDGSPATGDEPAALEPGRARAIVTGALIPPGTEAVLRSESADRRGDRVSSTHPREPHAGQHIRRAGRESAAGETLIETGTRLNPAHIALAASAGVDALTLHAVPAVALLTTGDEVVESGAPSPGRVRDSFRIPLASIIGMLGAEVVSHRRLLDDRDAIRDAISSAAAPLIVTTGGTGASSADHVRAALRALEARFVFDGVAMRPGGPTCLASLPDGRLVMALPGNPLAAMVALLTLGGPLIATMSGRRAPSSARVAAERRPGRAGTTLIVPYRTRDGRAAPTGWDGSAMMRGLASADGLLVVPETGIEEGASAETVAVPWV